MTLKIFLLAGEASGDNLGAKLMAALTSQNERPITFSGVGGTKMSKHGMKSLFPMEKLSLVGFVEIIPHIPEMLRLIKFVVNEIETAQPDLVVTIDAPAFNMRVARMLRELGYKGKLVHYVAPSVWAYNPDRVYKVKAFYDHLLTLLPFEPPYFEKINMPSTFVGHPVTEDVVPGDKHAFLDKFKVAPDRTILAVMPGSRSGEIKRLMPVFGEAIKLLHRQIPNLHVAVLATEHLAHKVQSHTESWNAPHTVISNSRDKANALAASRFALIKSGTGSLEVALAGVPFVIAYKVNPLSAFILRRKIQVTYVNLINLIMNEPVIPEFLQQDCTPDKLALALEKLLKNPVARETQISKCAEALEKIGLGATPTPSTKAAETLLKLI